MSPSSEELRPAREAAAATLAGVTQAVVANTEGAPDVVVVVSYWADDGSAKTAVMTMQGFAVSPQVLLGIAGKLQQVAYQMISQAGVLLASGKDGKESVPAQG